MGGGLSQNGGRLAPQTGGRLALQTGGRLALKTCAMGDGRPRPLPHPLSLSTTNHEVWGASIHKNG